LGNGFNLSVVTRGRFKYQLFPLDFMAKFICETSLATPKNLPDYVKLKDTNLVIAREQSFNDMYFSTARAQALQEGTPMASPAIFLPYRNEVMKAAHGDATLYDGKGRRITRKDAEKLAHLLTKDCVVWLDAQFHDSKEGMQIAYSRIKDASTIEEVTEALQLKKNIHGGRLVDMVFNEQGMPVRNSRKQEFDAKNNIYFYFPSDGSVARFSAVANWAVLDCDWDRQDSYSALGLFACAAGAQKFLKR